MTRTIHLLAAVLALALMAAACGDDDSSSATSDAGDTAQGGDEAAGGTDAESSGDDTDAEMTEQRIVSLSATATETIFAIGADDQLVAVDNFSTYPENDLPAIDSFSPSVEAISEYEPDLVVLAFDPGDLVTGLDAVGIESLVQPAAATLDDAYAQIEQLGAATGHVGEAAELVLSLQTDLDALVAEAPDASGTTYYHELGEELYSLTSQTFAGEIYARFGLENIADPADEDGSSFGYPQLVEEFVIDADPDIIFLADTVCCGQDATTVAARPGWAEMSAVAAGHVVELDDDIASRWGPRVVDFAEAIAAALEDAAVPA